MTFQESIKLTEMAWSQGFHLGSFGGSPHTRHARRWESSYAVTWTISHEPLRLWLMLNYPLPEDPR